MNNEYRKELTEIGSKWQTKEALNLFVILSIKVMNHLEVVQLAVYDLSRGVIKSYASSLLGIEVEAIYHTGVRVYGYEYFFSNGIQRMTPEDVRSSIVAVIIGGALF